MRNLLSKNLFSGFSSVVPKKSIEAVTRLLTFAGMTFGVFVLFAGLAFLSPVKAQVDGCDARNIPVNCPQPCDNDNMENCYVPDFDCVNYKFRDPSFQCCINQCKNAPSEGDQNGQVQQFFSQFNFFGTNIRLDPARIPSLLNLLVTTILGINAVYALFRGMYIGLVIRSQTIDDAEIQKVSAEARNLFIGAALSFGTIFIVQLVANFLGVGQITTLDFSNVGDTITIR